LLWVVAAVEQVKPDTEVPFTYNWAVIASGLLFELLIIIIESRVHEPKGWTYWVLAVVVTVQLCVGSPAYPGAMKNDVVLQFAV
jgi:hypothetical protein